MVKHSRRRWSNKEREWFYRKHGHPRIKCLKKASEDKSVTEIAGQVVDNKVLFIKGHLDVCDGESQEGEVPQQIPLSFQAELAEFLNEIAA